MKKVLLYLSVVSFCVSIFACSEDSVQQKLEAEKADRVDFIKRDGGYKQTTTGLYYKFTHESAEKRTVLDTASALSKKNMYANLSVYMAFYKLKEDDKRVAGDTITHNYLNGYFEPIEYTFGVSNLKPGLQEAFSMMKEGDKMRVVMSTSLYGTGLPTLGIEPMYTREYESVICDIELDKITTTTDPNLE